MWGIRSLYQPPMTNTSHVNRYYWLRYPLSIFFLILWFHKYLSCKEEAKRFLSGDSRIGIDERYERFLSYFKRSISLKNYTYTFISEGKILQGQSVFIVDSDIDWKTIGLLRHLVLENDNFFPCFLLHSFLSKKKKISVLWDMVDTFYGSHELENAISSKKPIILEKDFLFRNLDALNLVKKSYIPIILISFIKEGNRLVYKIGNPIKPNTFFNIELRGLKDLLVDKFNKLHNELLGEVKNQKNRLINWKELFTIN